MADDASAQPHNIQDFNQIAVVIFAQLYNAHPYEKTLDVADIAAVVGVTPTTVLPSGRRFDEVFESTVRWLHEQGYIHTRGSHARERVTLSAKALYAMNVVPPALQGPGGIPSPPQVTTGSTGTAMVQATEQAAQGRTKQLVDLAGTFIGAIIRTTLGSG